ncbi:MAG: SIMPL domain-containing protein [Polaromonas sp.]|nr:SIMPL domain-containing protein [Polaromonas sp.]
MTPLPTPPEPTSPVVPIALAQPTPSPLAAATVLALGLALGLSVGGWLLGRGLEHFRMADRVVTVKGLAEQDVPADHAIWVLQFRRAGNDFSAVQRALSQDRDQVLAFLKTLGFQEAELDVRPLQVQDAFAKEYAQAGQPLRYGGSGRVVVSSSRVQLVDQSAKATDPLILAGIQLGGDMEGGGLPRYQLRGFNAIKAPLLAEATRNAREQAQKFAAEAGAALGALKSANQGSIRVSDDDGTDMDSGNTLTKRLRVVSTFEYVLK